MSGQFTERGFSERVPPTPGRKNNKVIALCLSGVKKALIATVVKTIADRNGFPLLDGGPQK